MNRKKASIQRRRLLDAAGELEPLVRELVRERGPVVRGSLQLRGTRCGKENCKCNQGELHPTAVLVVSEGGERRSIYLRAAERQEVQRRVERYRRFRKTRAAINKLHAEILRAADELLEALVEPHSSLRDDEVKGKPDRQQKSRSRGR